MSLDAMIAALAGALIMAGIAVLLMAVTGTPVFPEPPAGRPGLRRIQWRSRRTLIETGVVMATAIAAWAATGWVVAAPAVAAAVIALPRLLGGRAAQQRIAQHEALETWTRQLADALTTGSGIEDALLATATDPPAPIAEQVLALRRRLEYRVTTEDAVRAFADELANPVSDTIAATLIIATQHGRNLHDVLTSLADTVAKDVAMQRTIDAERATHRTTTKWVTFALGAFVAFAVLNRAYVAPFSTAIGQMMLAVVAALFAGAIWWLHKLASPAPTHRFLSNSRGSRRRSPW